MRKFRKKPFKNYQYIDLFCGIGGFHYAMKSLGAKCVFASDINIEAQKVYKNNFGITPNGDIKKIKTTDIPKHDIICAGFPCQPFSISGSQEGLDSDVGKLFYEIIRIAEYHKPKIIFLENVRNLEKHKNGQTFLTMRKELEKIGYCVFYQVLNSVNFGVPQARKRLYIVAFRHDLHVNDFEFPNGKWNKKCILQNFLEDNVSETLTINDEYIITNDDTNITPSNKPIKIGYTGLSRQGERIYSIKGAAITLSSQGGGPAGKTGMYLIDGNVRRLSSRECANIMGFPHWHKLANTDGKNYKQFGNSVVINVIQDIMNEAGKLLERSKSDEKY